MITFVGLITTMVYDISTARYVAPDITTTDFTSLSDMELEYFRCGRFNLEYTEAANGFWNCKIKE